MGLLSIADERFMIRCAELAAEARRQGNTPVGTVIAIGDRVVAEAQEEAPAGPDRFAHAELLAVKRALQDPEKGSLEEATLYTTAEPCLLCAFAIREARIGRVVMKTRTPDIGGVTSRYPILLANDIERWGTPPRIEWTSMPD